MKKAFIFIAIATLLIILLIPNIAFGQECITPDMNVDIGCPGEETKITIVVNGWSTLIPPDTPALTGSYCLKNADTNESIIYSGFLTFNDPFTLTIGNNLPEGNYYAAIYYHIVSEQTYDCPLGVNLGDPTTWYTYYFSVTECPEPEPCYCSLLVQKRDEAGHPINGAVFKVDGIEKKTVNGDARWDDLECGLAYEVRELSPNKYTERIRLEDECEKRSTLRIVNETEEEVVEVVEEVIIPEAGLDLNFLPVLALGVLTTLSILLTVNRKR